MKLSEMTFKGQVQGYRLLDDTQPSPKVYVFSKMAFDSLSFEKLKPSESLEVGEENHLLLPEELKLYDMGKGDLPTNIGANAYFIRFLLQKMITSVGGWFHIHAWVRVMSRLQGKTLYVHTADSDFFGEKVLYLSDHLLPYERLEFYYDTFSSHHGSSVAPTLRQAGFHGVNSQGQAFFLQGVVAVFPLSLVSFNCLPFYLLTELGSMEVPQLSASELIYLQQGGTSKGDITDPVIYQDLEQCLALLTTDNTPLLSERFDLFMAEGRLTKTQYELFLLLAQVQLNNRDYTKKIILNELSLEDRRLFCEIFGLSYRLTY